MKISKIIKHSTLMAAVVAISVGCASTQQEEPADAPAAKKAGACEQVLKRAEAARKKANSIGHEWRDIKKIMKKAKKALDKGEKAKCLKLATRALHQGELGYAQGLAEQGRSADGSYTVSSGDSLWSISGKSSIYGDPYQWPLIYKANRSQINDADLIYPGQNLAIDQSATSADIDAAVRHAKTRGAWTVGAVEDSDTAYLAR